MSYVPPEEQTRLLTTSPTIAIAYFSAIAGVMLPAGLTVAVVSGAEVQGDTPAMLVVLWILMLAGLTWSIRAYRSIRVAGHGIVLQRGLLPFRTRQDIRFSSIRRAYIIDYTHKLVLELTNDTTVVVANRYSVLRTRLPEVKLDPHEPGGPYKILKTLRAFFEMRREGGEPRDTA